MQRLRRGWAAITAFAVLALLVASAAALAAPGDLDPTFAGDGTRTIGFGGEEMAHGIALNEAGEIFLAGGPTGAGQNTSDDFKVAGLTADGTPNPAFGGADDLPDGIVVVPFGTDKTDQARAIAVQDEGKVVVAGRSNSAGATMDFALVRLNPDGSMDQTFAGGLVTTDFGTGNAQTSDEASSVTVDAEGRIVAAGLSGSNFAIARYRPNGTLDSSFSGDGKLTVDFGGTDTARSVAIAPDGKIVVAGDGTQAGDLDFALARVNPSGSLDTTFGGDGRVTVPISETLDDIGSEVAIRLDGKIVVAGLQDRATNTRAAVVQLEPDGDLDPAFAGGAPKVIDAGAGSKSGFTGVALAPNGKIIAVGDIIDGSLADMMAMRVLPNGELDPTFGTSGVTTLDAEFGGTSAGSAATVLSADGGILVAGWALGLADGQDFAVAKIEGDPLNLDTVIDSGPPSDVTLTVKDVEFSFSSPSPGVVGFECAFGNAAFSACSSPVSHKNVADGRHGFRVRAINTLGARDPSPAASTFTIDTTAPWLRIKRKKLKVDPKGRTTAKLKCSFERSGPCEGVIAVKTVGKFSLARPAIRAKGATQRGKRAKRKLKTIRLARSRYSLATGKKLDLRLRIAGKRKRKLIRRNRDARKVSVIGKVRDQLGNRDRVIKEMKVVLVKGKGKGKKNRR